MTEDRLSTQELRSLVAARRRIERLHEAAPDLLAASKALLSCRWMVETVSAEVDALREAVAKAEKGDA